MCTIVIWVLCLSVRLQLTSRWYVSSLYFFVFPFHFSGSFNTPLHGALLTRGNFRNSRTKRSASKTDLTTMTWHSSETSNLCSTAPLNPRKISKSRRSEASTGQQSRRGQLGLYVYSQSLFAPIPLALISPSWYSNADSNIFRSILLLSLSHVSTLSTASLVMEVRSGRLLWTFTDVAELRSDVVVSSQGMRYYDGQS